MSTHGTQTRPGSQDTLSDVELQTALSRMRAYARALEQRCNHLWTYVPDTHGRQDPAIPFVANVYEVSDLDRTPDAD